MPITPLPDPPSRQDPANFSARADAFLAALPTFATEMNALSPGESAAGLAQSLAIGAGAALVRFVPAGAGAGTMTAQDKGRQVVHMDDYYAAGTPGTQAADSAALKSALNYAASLWLPVMLPARRIYWDGTPITHDKVRIWGAGMPGVNAGRTALVGGTIIEGPLILSGTHVDLRNLGADLGSAGAGPDVDGIKVTCSTLNGGVHLHAENLVALCKASLSPVHALLFEGYGKFTGGNVTGVHGFFGCVIKCTDVQLSSVDTDQNGDTGLYLKSDSLYGTMSDIQIGSVRTKNAPAMGTRIQGDSATVKHIQIGQIHGSDHGRSVVVQLLDPSGVDMKSVEIGSLISERAATADLSILSLKVGLAVNSVSVGSLVAIDGTGKTVETSCSPGAFIRHLGIRRLYASYPAGASQATMDSAVFLDGGVLSSDLASVDIVENYGAGAKFGAVNYQNVSDPKAHTLGSHRCKVIGGGRPLPGNLNQTLTGATATLLIPENTSGEGKSFCRVTITAGATITTFSPEWATQTFNLGHLLFVYNNSAFTLSVGHNAAQGIINQSSATVNLAGSEVACWAHVGSGIWSQLKIA